MLWTAFLSNLPVLIQTQACGIYTAVAWQVVDSHNPLLYKGHLNINTISVSRTLFYATSSSIQACLKS
jgi:hypothetical protein